MRSKASFLALFIFLFILSVCAQSNDECRYLMVITYLKTNLAVNENIKEMFPKRVNKKEKFVQFNLSDKVSFISIRPFLEKVSKSDSILKRQLIDLSQLNQTNYFTTFRSEFLKRLQIVNDSILYLAFSKSISNYIVVEISDFVPGIYDKKYGRALDILFRFDLVGGIDQVLYNGAAYN